MKTIRYITYNSPGLIDNDTKIFEKEFKKYSYTSEIVLIEQNPKQRQYKFINLFLEGIPNCNLKYIYPAKYNLFMPNLEHFRAYEQIKYIDIILCKTYESYEYFNHYALEHNITVKIYYIKFYSYIPKDIIPQQKNPNLFICLAGKSPFKNVEYVINCWIKNNGFINIDPLVELHITCYGWCWESSINKIENLQITDNIINYKNLYVYIKQPSYEYYVKLITTANVAICISRKEGYGHYINESRYFNTWVISMDNPPMNELIIDGKNGSLLKNKQHYYLQKEGKTSWKLYNAIPDIMELADKIIWCINNKNNLINSSNKMFNMDKQYFKNKMKKIIIKLK